MNPNDGADGRSYQDAEDDDGGKHRERCEYGRSIKLAEAVEFAKQLCDDLLKERRTQRAAAA
jgi:hypothetical protein